MHGNTGRVPHNALSLEDVQHIVQFILHYAEVNAVLLPGRIPGYKRDDVQLLPCSTTKRSVWLVYKEATRELSLKTAAYSTFLKLWQHLLPNIIVARPMTDLCLTCQQNSTAIIRSANLTEEVKSKVKLSLVPTRSHLQYLITCSMQIWRRKAWEIWSHAVYQVDRG